MQIRKNQNGSSLVVELEGRLDTVTAPELEADLKGTLDGVSELVLDLANLEYVSSAGLRVLLALHRQMSSRGKMPVKNVNTGVMEVFEMTGFANILSIEK